MSIRKEELFAYLMDKQAAATDPDAISEEHAALMEEGSKLAMAIQIGDMEAVEWVKAFQGTPLYVEALTHAQQSSSFLAEAQQVASQMTGQRMQLEQQLLDFQMQSAQPQAPAPAPPAPAGTGGMGAMGAPKPAAPRPAAAAGPAGPPR